jgi:hypothetical protein
MFIQLILGNPFALDAVLYDLFQFDRGQLGDKIGASEVSMVGCVQNYFFMKTLSNRNAAVNILLFLPC